MFLDVSFDYHNLFHVTQESYCDSFYNKIICGRYDNPKVCSLKLKEHADCSESPIDCQIDIDISDEDYNEFNLNESKIDFQLEGLSIIVHE